MHFVYYEKCHPKTCHSPTQITLIFFFPVSWWIICIFLILLIPKLLLADSHLCNFISGYQRGYCVLYCCSYRIYYPTCYVLSILLPYLHNHLLDLFLFFLKMWLKCYLLWKSFLQRIEIIPSVTSIHYSITHITRIKARGLSP